MISYIFLVITVVLLCIEIALLKNKLDTHEIEIEIMKDNIHILEINANRRSNEHDKLLDYLDIEYRRGGYYAPLTEGQKQSRRKRFRVEVGK